MYKTAKVVTPSVEILGNILELYQHALCSQTTFPGMHLTTPFQCGTPACIELPTHLTVNKRIVSVSLNNY